MCQPEFISTCRDFLLAYIRTEKQEAANCESQKERGCYICQHVSSVQVIANEKWYALKGCVYILYAEIEHSLTYQRKRRNIESLGEEGRNSLMLLNWWY